MERVVFSTSVVIRCFELITVFHYNSTFAVGLLVGKIMTAAFAVVMSILSKSSLIVFSSDISSVGYIDLNVSRPPAIPMIINKKARIDTFLIILMFQPSLYKSCIK